MLGKTGSSRGTIARFQPAQQVRVHIFPVTVTLLVFLLITIPYLLSASMAGSQAVFGGFLLNPRDGFTYLAKMYQGWRGGWLFTLPFTAEPGSGVLLFTYYLTLGHVARLFGLPLVLVYHLARIAGSLFLIWALYRFFSVAFKDPYWKNMAYLLGCLGLGLGWLAVPFGQVTADFWVAEAYPFLSAYTNPHFPLSLGLVLWLLTPENEPHIHPLWNLLAGILLVLLSPFGVVLVAGVLACNALWVGWSEGLDLRSRWLVTWRVGRAGPALWLLAGGLPFLFYYLWIVTVHPELGAWNAQNLTPSPAAWDLVLSLSPALLLAALGARQAFKYPSRPGSLLLAWALVSLVCIALPWGLQRRFMMGISVPLVGLAVIGLQWIHQAFSRLGRILPVLVVFSTTPTLLLVIFAGLHGAANRDPALYLTSGERAALQWIEENTSPGALILAAPETGLLIPAYTGRRVIYGHPFETIHAGEEEAAVRTYFESGGAPPETWEKWLKQRQIDFIFYGPREALLGSLGNSSHLTPVYSEQGIILYAVLGQ